MKQEREAVVDCMMELEGDFLTATNEKKVTMILDQACRNVNVGKSIKKLCRFNFHNNNSGRYYDAGTTHASSNCF